MKLKSYRSAVALASLLAGLSLLPAGWLAAQTPTPTPTPARTPVGFVRFWNLTPPTAGIILELVLAVGPDGRVINTATPSNFYANYVSLPPGPYALRVFRKGDRQSPIKSINLPLRDRSYFTFLATPQPDGQTDIELIDDTPDPTKAPNNRLTVRQYAPDTSVVITAANNYRTDILAYGKTGTLSDLPDGLVSLKMRATKPGMVGVRTWETQADFRASHHSTLFIVNDLYGRIRARVAMDGPSPADEAEAAAAAKAAATIQLPP